MSRFKRAFHNAVSSWAVLGTATAHTLVSVPLALHYLSKERFALWALMSSISAYMSLIDLGMSGSVSRLLIDHKDERLKSNYGSLIQTGWLVLTLQGLLLLVCSFGLAPFLATALDIPSGLESDFIALMRWQGVTMALNFTKGILAHILYAHQRSDLNNYVQVASLVASLGSMWWLFHAGYGVFSLVWAGLVAASVIAVGHWVACWLLKLFPAPGCWGRPSSEAFRELFVFGKDLFLVSVGGMLLQASQTLIITRRLGLELAAVWAVGTKAYSLVVQLIWRTSDSAGPGFGEMLARREETALLNRYRMVVMLSASLAAFCAVSYVLCNSPFVTIWTAGKNNIVWNPGYDLLLGACLIVSTVVHSHTCFIGITKRLHFLRYIFFIEGLVFILTALLVARRWQLFGIISASLLCSIVFTGIYTTFRIMRFFHLSLRDVAWEWFIPMRAFLWRATIVGLALWYITYSFSPLVRLLVHAMFSATLVLLLLARYGVPTSFQEELLRRAPLRATRVLGWLFGSSRCVPQPKLT